MSLRRRNVLAARRRGGGGWDFRNGFILPTVSAVVLLVAAYLLIPVFKTREGDVKNPAGEPPFHIRVREAYAETIDGRSFVFPRRLPISSFAFLNLPLSKDPSKDVKALIKEREAQDDLRFAGLGGLRVGVHSSREARSA